MIRETHVFIEGGGDDRLMRQIIQALHPEFLSRTGMRLFRHDVPEWPSEPFVHAAVTLRVRHGIALRTDNCLLQDGSAFGNAGRAASRSQAHDTQYSTAGPGADAAARSAHGSSF